MAHISKVGRKSWSSRSAFTLMYILLIGGGITMLLPFMVMVSNSFKSNLDAQSYDLIPVYFTQQKMLTMKYIEQQSNYDVTFYNQVARKNVAAMKEMALPSPASAEEVADYNTFVAALPVNYTITVARGAQWDSRTYGIHPMVTEYRAAIFAQYQSVASIQQKYGTQLADLQALSPPQEFWNARWYQPQIDDRMADFLAFKKRQPLERLVPVAIESIWPTSLRTKHGADIATINTKLGTTYTSFDSIDMPLQYPVQASAEFQKAWEECIRKEVPIWFIRADQTALSAWHRFLRDRFQQDISLYLKAHPTVSAVSFDDISLPAETPLTDTIAMGEWNDFVGKGQNAPATSLYLDTAESRYRNWLMAKYGTTSAINKTYGTQYVDAAAIFPPTIQVMVTDATTNAGKIRTEFVTRNYRSVIDYLLLHGRSFFNTIIFILLSLLVTLTVNPVTAYALSRFNLKSTNKLLLFLMATMAFPAEIAMIPNFLLLRELGLLNTFWALVLPGMANGFSIFLLKGMFDGLPQDLYEAAELDGASELVIFWRITMPLVKPFLAYMALGTFIGAYSAFAFAFILCPNPKMWTMMVYLQQMDWASQPIRFAAYVLASIPTLIVFVTCQRIIMQGIVLPTEK